MSGLVSSRDAKPIRQGEQAKDSRWKWNVERSTFESVPPNCLDETTPAGSAVFGYQADLNLVWQLASIAQSDRVIVNTLYEVEISSLADARRHI